MYWHVIQLYFQIAPDVDGQRGQMSGTFVQGELVDSMAADWYENPLMRLGHHDFLMSTCCDAPAPGPFRK